MKISSRNSLYREIKNILQEARQSAYRSVNFAMVIAYWQIGKKIVEQEQKGKSKASYGSALLKESLQLTADFGKGYSETNLKYFRQFYITFSENKNSHALRDQSLENTVQKSHALRTELSWTHYRLLMRVENKLARSYYIQEAIAQNWSTRALECQINFTFLINNSPDLSPLSPVPKHSALIINVL
jgi:predicted nuclease of restriction endonuclease-like (RecB) superfamily